MAHLSYKSPLISLLKDIIANMSTHSFNPSNKSPTSTLALPSLHSTSPPSIPVLNPEYFKPAINNMATLAEGIHTSLFKEMCTNPNLQPPPLSSYTALQAIKELFDISFTLVTNITKGLAVILNKHNQEHFAEKTCLEDCICGMEDKVKHYENTFSILPEGYIENNDHYPSLTIPISNGLFQPAKWIKQLDSGKVAMLAVDNGPNS